jgi:hypothetical protein
VLKDAFQAGSSTEDFRIDWHPDASPLISRGAAERGLELLEQRIAASSAGIMAHDNAFETSASLPRKFAAAE